MKTRLKRKILIVGSVALDTVKSPWGKVKDALGGSAVYSAYSASLFSKTAILAAVGRDFPSRNLKTLSSRSIDLSGLQIADGRTFRWSGKYSANCADATTLKTELNVLGDFRPRIPKNLSSCGYLFLANIDPDLQLSVISQVKRPKLIIADTMDFWIKHKKNSLKKLLNKTDIILFNESEARLFTGEENPYRSARKILSLGPKLAIIKKGEHGSFLCTKKIMFFAPAYPLERIADPTGAGDSFAGGLIGYICKEGRINESIFRKAVLYGTLMASFTVEDFSIKGLAKANPKNLQKRFNKFKKMILI